MSTKRKMDPMTILLIAQLIIEIIKMWQAANPPAAKIAKKASVKKLAGQLKLSSPELDKIIALILADTAILDLHFDMTGFTGILESLNKLSALIAAIEAIMTGVNPVPVTPA
jgi:hypothetical protein